MGCKLVNIPALCFVAVSVVPTIARGGGCQQARMMSDTTVAGEAEAEVEAAPVGELTELARLEIRIGKIVEVSEPGQEQRALR